MLRYMIHCTENLFRNFYTEKYTGTMLIISIQSLLKIFKQLIFGTRAEIVPRNCGKTTLTIHAQAILRIHTKITQTNEISHRA